MGNLVGGGNAILLLLSALAIGGASLIAVIAWRRHQPAVARTFAGGAGIIAVTYIVGLITASAASTERTIDQGDTKWFCGFYLDCHLGMSVEGTESVTSLPASPGVLQAKGTFHIISVRLENSARNPNIDMVLYDPRAKIIDALGNVYLRSAAAEAALGAGRPPALGAETRVGHEPVNAALVFDLPQNIQQPRLMVTEGWLVDRIIELGLINDENSILHKRAFFAIDGSVRTASSQEQ